MKIVLIIISTVLLGLIITYSWFNRDSDRVVLTLIAAMTAGALGFIAKESISNKPETFSSEIPVAVFYGIPTYGPLNIKLPYSHDLEMLLQTLSPEEIPKEVQKNLDIGFAQKKYFDALQIILVTKIFQRFSNGWNVEVQRMQTPNGVQLGWRYLEGEGVAVKLSEFLEAFPKNYFLQAGYTHQIPTMLGGSAVLPPGTTWQIDLDEGGKSCTIRLKNKFVSLSIKLMQSSAMVGIGEYTRLFGMDPVIKSNTEYGHAVYRIHIEGSQNYWLNGHPNMKPYRNWANSIVELLETEFNYELIREGHLREVQMFGPEGIQNIPSSIFRKKDT